MNIDILPLKESKKNLSHKSLRVDNINNKCSDHLKSMIVIENYKNNPQGKIIN